MQSECASEYEQQNSTKSGSHDPTEMPLKLAGDAVKQAWKDIPPFQASLPSMEQSDTESSEDCRSRHSKQKSKRNSESGSENNGMARIFIWL